MSDGHRNITCISCGYDLHGSQRGARCPECGTAIGESHGAANVDRVPRRVKVTSIVLAIVFGGPSLLLAVLFPLWPMFVGAFALASVVGLVMAFGYRASGRETLLLMVSTGVIGLGLCVYGLVALFMFVPIF